MDKKAPTENVTPSDEKILTVEELRKMIAELPGHLPVYIEERLGDKIEARGGKEFSLHWRHDPTVGWMNLAPAFLIHVRRS